MHEAQEQPAMVMDLLTGLVLLPVLYTLPGLAALRRADLTPVTRIVMGTALTYPVMTALLVAMGAADQLRRPVIVLAWLVLMAVAVAAPVPAAWIAPDGARLRGPLLGAAGFGVLLFVQALRPALFRSNDAMAVWAPLARDIANSGTIDPGWLPTPVEGFPPSIALVAGSVSRVTGGFAEAHAFIAHPFFAVLFLMAAVMLGGWLGGRWAGWLTLLMVLSTPLWARGVILHDDLLAAFMTTAAVLLALRAEKPPSWALVGVLAGGAFAVKHLGLVAALLVGVVLVARLPELRAWPAAAAGWLIGLPWYLWNVVRWGNPVHPLLPGVFGEPEPVARIVADITGSLRFEERAVVADIGGLTVLLLVVGAVAALWTTDPERRRLVIAMLIAVAAFVAVWQYTGYRTRHLWQVIPFVAAVGSAGLVALAPKRFGSRWGPGLALGVAALLLLVTAGDVQRDYWGKQVPDDFAQTGVYRVLQGKWRDLRTAVAPPEDEFEIYANVGPVWDELARHPAEPWVFSFDHRRYYIPQNILFGADVAALSVYDAPDAAGRHAALLEAGVGYLLDSRERGPRHPLYESGPWQDARERPDLYRRLYRGGGFRLYELVRPLAGS